MIKEHINTYQYSFQFSDLNIHRETIERSLGYIDCEVPYIISESIDELIFESSQHTDIRCGFVIQSDVEITNDSSMIRCGEIIFNTDSIITKRLRKSVALALFVTTTGMTFQNWSQELSASNDMMKTFIVDTIGSEIAEKAADLLEIEIQKFVQQNNWNVTNRYSPGYCGWDVSEQQKLFSLLPQHFCGVSLTESSLMIPIKSVSGIIGLGPDVQREEYQCSICDMKDCFRRKE